MKKIVSKLAYAGLTSLALVSGTAEANTTTHGSNWHAYNRTEYGDIDYIAEGARNLAAGGASRDIIGAVGFHPAPGWAGGSATFYIDGKNIAGNVKTTYFTLSAYNYNGTLQSTVSFNSSAENYDIAQTLTNLNVYSYVTLIANMPSSSYSVLRGVTVIQ